MSAIPDWVFPPVPVTEIDASTQRVMSFPVGQLDWIAGFDVRPGGKIRVGAYLTPALRCFGSVRYEWSRMPVCEAIVRTGGPTHVHAIPLRILERLRPGGHYFLRRSLADVTGTTHRTTLLGNAPEMRSQDRVLELADERSTVLTFRHIKKLHPQIAGLIERWAPCPDPVAFYIASHEETTIIIPTAEILRSHYFPRGDMLERFLTATDQGPFVGRFAAFDGFKYISPHSDEEHFCYPVRAQRNIARAEHEIWQLMPRAVAYYRRYGDALPLLIRPPFVGKVRVEGSALIESIDGSEHLFFPAGCSFAPPAKVRRSSYIEKAFAPHIDRYSVSLSALRCGIGWRAASLEGEACNIWHFPRMTKAIVNARVSGALKVSSAGLLHGDNFSRIREWILQTDRV